MRSAVFTTATKSAAEASDDSWLRPAAVPAHRAERSVQLMATTSGGSAALAGRTANRHGRAVAQASTQLPQQQQQHRNLAIASTQAQRQAALPSTADSLPAQQLPSGFRRVYD